MALETLRISTQPKFELSPFLYMQFMEPLGDQDPSVEAAWNFQKDRWHDDVINVSRWLGPKRYQGMVRTQRQLRQGLLSQLSVRLREGNRPPLQANDAGGVVQGGSQRTGSQKEAPTA